MSQELLTFQKFKDAEVAKEVAEKLADGGIYYETESEEKFFDPSFSVNSVKNNIALKLRPSDFIKANKILDDYYKSQINLVGSDYYLFDFTNEELQEILTKPDEWGHMDYQLAQVILKDRGKEINEVELASLKEERKQELSKPEKSQHWLVITGYFIAASSPFWNELVRFAGFFLAIIIGSILSSAKKTLPDGETVFMYAPTDRRQGKIIIIVAIILAIGFLIFRVYQ